ncbi:MAG: class I SAM-dependent methyltransferase [Desulfobulbus sp.]|jgi:2-polyprenyl-3-methyl-5-hydroxy-6-metoxy-1,4-benzoquinol methylase|uniref:class I SAM-dependent methyltransferase n=1 Tax=Desulfobulbus sp. TaxID=895 RepID=UPI0028429F82|nr:class I SAM-dependent methyltransferase [Desulfobulbus sp.]MDR2550389.1 class I SAM-dependent methyltransferase [Desulfobulbus sp.]
MKFLVNIIFLLGRYHGKIIYRHKKYSKIIFYVARGLHFIMTGVFPEEIIRRRSIFYSSDDEVFSKFDKLESSFQDNIFDIQDVRKYIDEEYWERGVKTGKSSYDGICSLVGIAESVGKQFTLALELRNKKLLDLGCASGQTVKAFRGQGVNAYGIDLSDYAIEAGKKTFGLDGIILQGSIHDLSRWERDEFDFLFSNQVLEHLPEQYVPEFIEECFRVLKPGGAIWIGLVLSLSPDPEGIRTANDIDETHINLHYRSWWNNHFVERGFVLDEKILTAVEGTPIWFEFGWSQIAYRKPLLSSPA